MIRNKQNFLPINQFAILCGTTPRTLRFYHQKGLLKPKKVDNQTGYRYYSPEQVKDFSQLKLLQSFKLPLSNLKDKQRLPFLEQTLNKQLESIRLGIENKNKEYFFLKSIKEFLYHHDSPQKFVKIEILKPFTIFGTTYPKIGYNQIEEQISEVKKVAQKLKIPLTNQVIVRYHQPNLYQPKETILDIGFVCQNKIIKDLPKNFSFKKFPKQKALTYLYQGPKSYLTFIHQKLFYSEYFQRSKFSDLPFDWEFLNGKKSEYEDITKIVYPII